MANNLNSNVTRKVARVFLDAFEASRVLTKTVNTQLLSGKPITPKVYPKQIGFNVLPQIKLKKADSKRK